MNSVAAQAATELSAHPTYKGPRDGANNVTPDLLFRGHFPGETTGPYLSQFLLQDTTFGEMDLVQKYNTFKAKVDFMLTAQNFEDVQNGKPAHETLQMGAPLYLYDGRGLAAYTRIDVLYQAYFVAYLVLNNKSLMVPPNKGNPYKNSTTQNGFNTFGGPDFAATVAAVASEALKAVWFQKWYVHLRHRPESGGGIVHLIKTGQGAKIKGHVNANVLDSQALKSSYANSNSYLLPQAFPEGSPRHPAYPTGHGTVAGACITVLKFFFDGDYKLPKDRVLTSSKDGSMPPKYMGADAANLSVNGELNKLASNISFGHGIHAGIHWRSDTDTSIELGEEVALRLLQDRAHTYNEKFSVQLTKLNGTKVTITNP